VHPQLARCSQGFKKARGQRAFGHTGVPGRRNCGIRTENECEKRGELRCALPYELGEFSAVALDSLRQPLEDGANGRREGREEAAALVLNQSSTHRETVGRGGVEAGTFAQVNRVLPGIDAGPHIGQSVVPRLRMRGVVVELQLRATDPVCTRRALCHIAALRPMKVQGASDVETPPHREV
jgi:hypothetical protein